MQKLHIALTLALLLSACATPGVQHAVSCRSYAATLSSLAELRAADDLSQAQIQTVDRLRPIANAICTNAEPTSSALMRLSDVLREMSRIQTEASR